MPPRNDDTGPDGPGAGGPPRPGSSSPPSGGTTPAPPPTSPRTRPVRPDPPPPPPPDPRTRPVRPDPPPPKIHVEPRPPIDPRPTHPPYDRTPARKLIREPKEVRVNHSAQGLPIPVGLGRYQDGARYSYVQSFSSGTILYMIAQHGHGPIQSATPYLDGEVMTWSAPNSRWEADGGYSRAWFFDGSQVAISGTGLDLTTLDATAVSEEVHTGHAFTIFRFAFKIGQRETLPDITFDMEGFAEVTDLRVPSTGYSENFALHAYEFLTNTDWGVADSATTIDVQSFEDAADYCDETVTATGANKKRWWGGMLIGLEAGDELSMIRAIAAHFRARILQVDGKWTCLLNVPLPGGYTPAEYSVPAETIDEASFTMWRKERSELPNEVVVWFSDEANRWENTVTPPAQTAAVIAGTEKPRQLEMRLYGIHDSEMAGRMKVELFNLSWDDLCCSFETDPRGSGTLPNDVIHVTAAGLTQQKFRVQRNEDDSGKVRLVCIEYQAASYSDTPLSEDAPISWTPPTAGYPYDTPPYPGHYSYAMRTSPDGSQLHSWSGIPVRSTTKWGAAFWSTVNCTNVDAAKINDGVLDVKALDINTAGESKIKIDLGSGNDLAFDEILATFSGAGFATFIVESSNDDATYTSRGIITNSGPEVVSPDGSSFLPVRRVGWLTPDSAYRYWQLRQSTSSALDVNILELQFMTYDEAYPARSVVICESNGDPVSGGIVTADAAALNVGEDVLGSFSYTGLNNSGFSKSGEGQAHSISVTGRMGYGVDAGVSAAVASASTSGFAPDYIAKGVTSPSLSNGVNNNVAISSIASVMRCSGPTAAFSIAGLVAKDGTDNTSEGGRLYTCWNDAAYVLTLEHDAASSTAANRLSTESGSDETVAAGGRFWVFYEESSSRWRTIVPPAAGRAILYHTFNWNPPSVAAGAKTSTDVTVTGAAVGDVVAVNKFSAEDRLRETPLVVSADTVRVYLRNEYTAAIDLGATDFYVAVIKQD